MMEVLGLLEIGEERTALVSAFCYHSRSVGSRVSSPLLLLRPPF
jgi:hypothetical protein